MASKMQGRPERVARALGIMQGRRLGGSVVAAVAVAPSAGALARRRRSTKHRTQGVPQQRSPRPGQRRDQWHGVPASRCESDRGSEPALRDQLDGPAPKPTPVLAQAVAPGTFPYIFNNDGPDGSFAVQTPIDLWDVSLEGRPLGTVHVPTNQETTSFSSKSELAINLSTDGQDLSFSGYDATGHVRRVQLEHSGHDRRQQPRPRGPVLSGRRRPQRRRSLDIHRHELLQR